jgi:ribosomal-protein-alanine N-acetyltransferase
VSPSSPELRIVDLEEGHLRAVMKIDASAYAQPWSKRLWKAELSRSGRVYLAAMADGRLLGYAGALVADDEAHVTTIVSAPDARRKGVGTHLMVGLIDRCLAMGATALTLEVRIGNDAAQAMYRRFGMAPVGIRKGYYEPDSEDALVMWAHDIDHPEYRERIDSICGSLEQSGANT